jgi:hypothetical protein
MASVESKKGRGAARERTRIYMSKLGGRWLGDIASASRADMQVTGESA